MKICYPAICHNPFLCGRSNNVNHKRSNVISNFNSISDLLLVPSPTQPYFHKLPYSTTDYSFGRPILQAHQLKHQEPNSS